MTGAYNPNKKTQQKLFSFPFHNYKTKINATEQTTINNIYVTERCNTTQWSSRFTLESSRKWGVVKSTAQIRDGWHRGLRQVAFMHHTVRVTRRKNLYKPHQIQARVVKSFYFLLKSFLFWFPFYWNLLCSIYLPKQSMVLLYRYLCTCYKQQKERDSAVVFLRIVVVNNFNYT